MPSADQVRKEARKLSKSVFDNWSALNRVVERHEATIQKRWLKRTREQRKRILLTA